MASNGTHWTETVLGNLDIGLLVLGGAWLAAEGVRAAHRRAYNLTKTETVAEARPVSPSFTKVDHEARQAALDRGDAYAAERALAEAAADPVAAGRTLPQWGKLARMASKVVAATIVALVPPTAKGIAAREGVDINMTDVAQRYPIGVGLALIILVISVVQLVRGGSKA